MSSSPVVPAVSLVCVGQAVFDHRFTVVQIPTQPTKVLAHDYLGLPGGMASGAAITAARLGAQAHLITRMGNDPMADLLMQRFTAEGIKCDASCRVPNSRTAVSSVVIDARGERQIIHAPTNAFERGAPLTPNDLDVLLKESAASSRPESAAQGNLQGSESPTTVIVCDPRWPQGAAMALRWARANQLPSVLDADIAPPEVLLPLVALADWAIFSEAALDAFFPAPTITGQLQQALDAGARHVAVTQGAKGVQWLEQLTLCHLPALSLAVKDTTGAGDAFHGAFAVALGQGKPARECVAFANHVAGLKVANGNGILGAPTLKELNQSRNHHDRR